MEKSLDRATAHTSITGIDDHQAAFINALQKALSLFFLRQVEKKFNDPGSGAMEVGFRLHDGLVAFLPDGLSVKQGGRYAMAVEDLRMYTNDKHLLINKND